MTPTETQQLKHLISLLQAKLDGRKLERHCEYCGPDYKCPTCSTWDCFSESNLAAAPNNYCIATEPVPEKPTIEEVRTQLAASAKVSAELDKNVLTDIFPDALSAKLED